MTSAAQTIDYTIVIILTQQVRSPTPNPTRERHARGRQSRAEQLIWNSAGPEPDMQRSGFSKWGLHCHSTF